MRTSLVFDEKRRNKRKHFNAKKSKLPERKVLDQIKEKGHKCEQTQNFETLHVAEDYAQDIF